MNPDSSRRLSHKIHRTGALLLVKLSTKATNKIFFTYTFFFPPFFPPLESRLFLPTAILGPYTRKGSLLDDGMLRNFYIALLRGVEYVSSFIDRCNILNRI